MTLFAYCMQVMAARLARTNEIASTMRHGIAAKPTYTHMRLNEKRAKAQALRDARYGLIPLSCEDTERRCD